MQPAHEGDPTLKGLSVCSCTLQTRGTTLVDEKCAPRPSRLMCCCFFPVLLIVRAAPLLD